MAGIAAGGGEVEDWLREQLLAALDSPDRDVEMSRTFQTSGGREVLVTVTTYGALNAITAVLEAQD